jgi:hypothetical protein
MCIKVPAIDELGCGENEAGVEAIHVISDNDLVFPLPAVDVDTHTISSDLVLVDALVAGFETWKFLEDNCKHDETANDNGQYDHLIELKIPKDDPVKRNLFGKMNSRCCRWSVIYTDKNGMTKLVTGLRFKDNFTTGNGGEGNDNNEYTVQFLKTGSKAYHYSGVIPVKT